MDFLALIAFVLFIAAICAGLAGSVIGWVREELRLMRADTFAPDTVLTHSDPRCVNTAVRLAKARADMAKRGTPTLLTGRPAWRRINPMSAPREAAKVLPMKRTKR